MTKGKLYGGAKNFRTQKVLIAAKLGKTEVEVQSAHPPADKFPFGQTPAFEDSQTTLFGADAIAAYVGKMDISAAVAQWLTWAEGSLLPNVLGYVLPSISVAALDQKIKNAVSKQDIPLEVVNSYKNELLAQLNVLDKMLLSKTFLVGERLSLADISVALDLLPAFQNVLDGAFRKSHVNLTRWFLTIVNQSAAKEVLGDVKLAEKISHFSESEFKKNSENLGHSVAKKEEKHHGHHDKRKHHDKKKDEPKKKEEPKKKTEKKEAAEEMDLAEQAAAEEPKQTDPFAGLPPTTFNMDACKRCYSNEDTLTVAIPHFWQNLDTDNWSIWYCEYKFPKELTLTFMSCNLISGMYQRLEKLKKNAFASMCLFGTDNDSTISGIWVWRGQELVFPLSPDWQVDYESYDWKKLDPNSEETKKMVQEYFLWEGDFGGKKFNQGKIFK